MEVRARNEADQSWSVETLRRAWGSTSVARMGELVDTATLPGLVAIMDGLPVGLLTFAAGDDEIEVVTLHAEREGTGVGRSLMDALLDEAHRRRARRIWLVTTNDNVRAISFYQRWGMDLVAFIRDGVAASRRLKPQIPDVGVSGIPVRHELVFALRLAVDGRPMTHDKF
jgi:ribosomal protein S18 acetylase RimI-like enzyme